MQQLFNRASRMCSLSEQCAHDIHERLLRWGATPHDAAAIVARLIDEHFINESRYAHAFAHDHIRYNHWGRLKIASALRQKRIDADTIEQVMHTIDDEWSDDYTEALHRTLQGDTASSTTLQGATTLTPRLMRRVASHGFTYDDLTHLLPSPN